ncbi:glycerol-3-phosphate dehydrogenase [NAD(+)] 2, chloroplastic [Physcomitrium patens]|uniref:Glycerol-3-phosphate dehydrogenase [NAD(+)] n=1 Tax=Physcomitrium patens TaxID=3218 RepID=A0A2K1L7Q6_PHYPA|nr:glycerol-3-phosphate dehydrogenase [NAD(+)] 2, chloroplastic-like [Physcomitrium patens]XP_024397711.1 glycerol-3-phosphate dehydrogenase [NAD(+)] 2, chloroplastic-like [Physcomitrium patens]PNR62042.1 hypothetical protein PHYPA_000466 [Physcomitrium patens]|eukprot:XP_024397624.1 glycerol-3-phosphate dehydrogenase [NAD(+)] 2, chloroplastic-like [Physcomitrella patens]
MAATNFYLPYPSKIHLSPESHIRSSVPCASSLVGRAWLGDDLKKSVTVTGVSKRPLLLAESAGLEFLASARNCASSSSWVGGFSTQKGHWSGTVCSLKEQELHSQSFVLDSSEGAPEAQITQWSIEDEAVEEEPLSIVRDHQGDGALISFDVGDATNSADRVNLETDIFSGTDEAAVPSSSGLFIRNVEERKAVRTAWEKLVRWSRSWQLLNERRKNALKKTKKIVVLGGGSFGTAMAVLLARNKADMNVTLLLRDHAICQAINDHHMNLKYFPRHQLPKNVTATTDPREALQDAQYCVHAVPVQSSSEFLRSIAEHVPATLPILSVSKGLELSTLEMMSQVIPRALGNPRQPVAVISGPSFAIELMDELPTAMVAASRDKELARACQQLLASRYLRVNISTDVIGVEMAGALKNVLAIAAGIVEGMNLGNNCMAALVAQGCSEIRWLAEKMGAKSHTLSGLSGSGDIMLTCFVNLSRNRSVGVRLGSGEKLEDILSSMSQVAEGVATAGAVISLAKKYRVQMPVLTAVARILDNELTPKTAVLALMSLPQVEEV